MLSPNLPNEVPASTWNDLIEGTLHYLELSEDEGFMYFMRPESIYWMQCCKGLLQSSSTVKRKGHEFIA